MSNPKSSVLYVGITNDIRRRVYEHKNDLNDGFTKKYNCKDLMYYDILNDSNQAIAREKQLKNWHREWKWNLIQEENPNHLDLAKDWYDD